MPKVRPTQVLRPKPLGSQRAVFLLIASQRELEGFLEMIGRGMDQVATWGEDCKSKEGRNIATAHAWIVAQAMLGLAKWPKVVADTNFKKALEAFWLSVMKDMEEENFPAQTLVFIFARPGVQSNVPAEIRGSEETALGTYARVVLRFEHGASREAHSETFQEKFMDLSNRFRWGVLSAASSQDRDASNTGTLLFNKASVRVAAHIQKQRLQDNYRAPCS